MIKNNCNLPLGGQDIVTPLGEHDSITANDDISKRENSANATVAPAFARPTVPPSMISTGLDSDFHLVSSATASSTEQFMYKVLVEEFGVDSAERVAQDFNWTSR